MTIFRHLYSNHFGLRYPRSLPYPCGLKTLGLIPECIVPISSIRASPFYLRDLRECFVVRALIHSLHDVDGAYAIFKDGYSKSFQIEYYSSLLYPDIPSPINNILLQRLLPWMPCRFQPLSSELHKAKTSDDMKRKATEYGFDSSKISDWQVQSISLINETSLEIEWARYLSVFKSIYTKGYLLGKNTINAAKLTRSKTSVFVVYDGLHKLFALAALGETSIRLTLSSPTNEVKIVNNTSVSPQAISNTFESLHSELLSRIYIGF